MKFLCDQCKAKYQIADDKVAGKTVRMKCRKCGHLIEVRAAVTETSVAGSIPPDSSDSGGPPRVSAPPAAPTGAAGPRPPPAKPPPPRGTPMATSLSAAKPPPPRPLNKPEPPAGLAAAFKTSVQHKPDDDAQKDLIEVSSADEWYCAINGVPVGPIRTSELRRKASQGAVSEDSLVWQEGFEEWRMLRTVPELAALVREAQAGGRVSLVTPEPPGALRNSTPPPVGYGRPPPPRTGGPSRVPEPPRAIPAAARNNVVPITSRLATAERLDDAPSNEAAVGRERSSVVADPFGPNAAPLTAPDAVTSTRVSAAPPSAAVAQSSFSIPPPVVGRAGGSPPWIVYAMLVLAAAFGVTAAIAVFFRPAAPAAPAPAPVVIQVPTPAATAAPVTEPDAIELEATASSAVVKPGTAKPSGAKPASSSTAKPIDPGIASLLNNGLATGPSSGGATGGTSSGTSLTTDQVEGVVRNHSLGVRRTCWERGAANSPSANIMVSVTVGAGGQVSNATANGNDPVVAKCIEGDVRTWRFPPTGSTTTVNIPFHFVRQ